MSVESNMEKKTAGQGTFSGFFEGESSYGIIGFFAAGRSFREHSL